MNISMGAPGGTLAYGTTLDTRTRRLAGVRLAMRVRGMGRARRGSRASGFEHIGNGVSGKDMAEPGIIWLHEAGISWHGECNHSAAEVNEMRRDRYRVGWNDLAHGIIYWTGSVIHDSLLEWAESCAAVIDPGDGYGQGVLDAVAHYRKHGSIDKLSDPS